MKMNPTLFMTFNQMISNRKQFFFHVCVWMAVALSALLAIAIIITAFRGDTTMLGDPYYEDQIMAWQRAFAPWAFTWLIVALSVALAIIGSLKTTSDNHQKKHASK